MPEMFGEHPGHLALRAKREEVSTTVLLCALSSLPLKRHYFVGDGFGGTAFDGLGFAEVDAAADGDGAAIGGVTAVP